MLEWKTETKEDQDSKSKGIIDLYDLQVMYQMGLGQMKLRAHIFIYLYYLHLDYQFLYINIDNLNENSVCILYMQ